MASLPTLLLRHKIIILGDKRACHFTFLLASFIENNHVVDNKCWEFSEETLVIFVSDFIVEFV